MRGRTAVVAALAALLMRSLLAGEEPSVPFSGAEEVTAVDLLVEVDFAGPLIAEEKRRAALGPADIAVRVDGENRPVIALESPEPNEPWQLVVYVDPVLTSQRDVAWAAGLLTEVTTALVALGEVELVIAQPRPASMLAPTRDASLLEQSLSGVLAEPRGSDQIVALRAEVLAALRSDELATDEQPVFLSRVVDEERRLVQERLDALLGWLIDRRGAGARRCLFLVSGGVDHDPHAFYERLASSSRSWRSSNTDAGQPSATLEDAARTAAAYGWIVVPLLAPPPDEPPRGVTIGRTRVRGFRGTVEEHRQPTRARAYAELATALIGQGKNADAEDALRQAIHHFGDARDTADEQAAAAVMLGKLLEARGEIQRAHQLFREARDLAPEVAAALGAAPAELLDPLSGLEPWAAASGGSVVRNAEQLAELLDSLGRRRRLTFQQSGAPDGSLRRVEVEPIAATLRLRSPGWCRHGSPGSVAELRARQLLRGEAPAGELAVAARIAADLRHGTVIRAAVADSGPSRERVLRWTVVGLSAYGEVLFVRRLHAPAEISLPLEDEAAWLGLVADEPQSGAWGGTVLELATQ